MNKTDLINMIANQTDMQKSMSEKMLNEFIKTVEANISSEDGIKLVGFGNFSISARKERKGRNPQTGEEIHIPAKNVPVFKFSKTMKDIIEKTVED